jgi:cysteinyl-tRNA synthetase
LLQLDAEKMSKSLGNLVTIKEVLEKHSADAVRIFVLGSHYRSPLTYSEEALEAAERGADRLRQTILSEEKAEVDAGIDKEAYEKRFIEAMDDDFNTPRALATLFDLARDINRLRDAGRGVVESQQLLGKLAGVLGVTLEAWMPSLLQTSNADIERLRRLLISINQWRLIADLNEIPIAEIPDDIDSLTELITSTRSALRDKKQWQYADEIRERLVELNIALEDTVRGTKWRYKR